MTRLLTYICSIYFLLLAVMPCTDYSVCAEDFTTSIDIQNSTTHDHSDPSSDICSPLCVCDCCGISVLQPDLIVFNSTKANFGVDKRDVIHTNIDTPFFSIWQPPRL